MRLGELTYLTDQIVTFGFSSLELRNKAALMVKRIFSMPLRASQGFMDSVFQLAQLPLRCPHYSCISR